MEDNGIASDLGRTDKKVVMFQCDGLVLWRTELSCYDDHVQGIWSMSYKQHPSIPTSLILLCSSCLVFSQPQLNLYHGNTQRFPSRHITSYMIN